MQGLLINGRQVPVEGVTVIGKDDFSWCRLNPKQFKLREAWLRQYIIHKSVADYPERVLRGSGPLGGDKLTLDDWAERKTVDGAHAITDFSGRVACLIDLARYETWHATVSNAWSIGHEMKEYADGRCFSATIDSTVAACLVACRSVGIQWQMPKLGSYTGHPITRMKEGGLDMIGIFGHRDNTERRGHWDPGDYVFEQLAKKGVMQFDYEKHEDIKFWKDIQSDLTVRGHYHGNIDGVAGPGTVEALKADGYIDGIYALGKPA